MWIIRLGVLRMLPLQMLLLLLLLLTFGKFALRGRALRVLLQLLPLVVIIAALLDSERRSTVATFTQVRLALASWRVWLADFTWLPRASIITGQGASLLVCQHVSVSLIDVVGRGWLLMLDSRFLTAVCADICRWNWIVAGLTLCAVVTLVRLLLEVCNLLL